MCYKNIYIGIELWESNFDGLLSLVNKEYNYCKHVGNMKT